MRSILARLYNPCAPPIAPCVPCVSCVPLALCALLALACNDHPVNSVNETISAVTRVENRLPAKTKLDFLFVIDNSASMCQEQARLSENFELFSRFLFDELSGAADYRIAVVSTDIGQQNNTIYANPSAARFLYSPAPQEPCRGGGAAEMSFLPNTADCPAPGDEVDPVISSARLAALSDDLLPPGDTREARLRAELERQFRCRANIEPTMNPIEKGLEATRLALSCKGPNAHLFSQCCVDYGSASSFYNPACVIPDGAPEPEFLRPDATLVVILISDEDDCSAPADAPAETSRLICRAGGAVDEDADGVPDIYALCRGVSPLECYQRECGDLSADAARCRAERCDVSNYGNLINCQTERGRLTSPREYRDFLRSLKARPLDQLLFAPIVGFRAYNDAGDLLVYNAGLPPAPECAISSNDPSFDVNLCCPDGVCVGQQRERFSCDIPSLSVQAAPGTRYLALADELGAGSALSCASGQEPAVDAAAQRITPQPGATCLNICESSFDVPLSAIKERVATLINTYCIDRLPECVVPAAEGEGRACATDEERASPANYALQVSRRCERAACEVTEPLAVLSPAEWSLRVGEGGCVAQVVLSALPPAGAEIIVELMAAVEQEVEQEAAPAP